MTILYALLALLVANLIITITSLYDLIIWLFISYGICVSCVCRVCMCDMLYMGLFLVLVSDLSHGGQNLELYVECYNFNML